MSDAERLRIARAQLRAIGRLIKSLPQRAAPDTGGADGEPDWPPFRQVAADPRRPVLYALDAAGDVWERVTPQRGDGGYSPTESWWFRVGMDRRTVTVATESTEPAPPRRGPGRPPKAQTVDPVAMDRRD